MKRILFVPDTHRPFHDQRAWEIMLQCARWWSPHTIVILGDFADCWAISEHDKSPERRAALIDEVPIVRRGLIDLGKLGAKEKYYIAGNHEWRYDRYIARHAQALWGVTSIQRLFDLDRLGWRYTPYHQTLRLGKLNITHDVGHAGKYAVHQTGAAFEGNVVFGHTHRMGVHYFGNAKGESHVAASFGWLGDKSQIDYLHGTKVNRDWQLGFGLGTIDDRGYVSIIPVPIVGYTATVGARVFRG